jgi:hypothetical protein
MKTNHALKLTLGLLVCASAFFQAPVSSALTVYHVDVNTAALMGDAAGPFSLDFQLNDGSGTGDGNNTATISNFTFGGGGATGSASLLGGATGDLTSGVTLTDNTPFNEFYQGFTAGGTLGFDVSLTLNPDAGLTPDAFVFAILDNNLMNIPTTGSGDSLLLINIGGAAPAIQTGASISPAGVSVTVVPEPSALAYAALGLALACVRARRGVKNI